ncbi:YfjI family protein [Rubripirellula sp.]|nr:YfjI family protein [Rubripirellula sp.]MDB4634097.1 YfjI family protein [Rubripirellula sp.]
MSEPKICLSILSYVAEGRYKILVKLGGQEIHRDCVSLDLAEERKRFIDVLVDKLPGIAEGGNVKPEDIDSQLIAMASKASPSIDWQEPVSLRQLDLPAFPVDALPPVLAKWVAAESEATQTPAAMAALLSLAVCATALAKRVTVSPWPGWWEPCNLYVAAILEPANRKSAVFSDATRPLREFESELINDTKSSVAEELSRYRQAESRLRKLEKTAAESADARKRAEAAMEAIELASKLATWSKPEEPTLIVDDATSEKLAMMMQANGERIASMSAEGGVFDLMAGKYSGGSTDINVYLMGHSGDAISVHRVMREPVKLASPALTMALAIQPEVIRGIAGTPAFRGRGLLGRFLYAIPKSWIGSRKIATPPVSDVVALAYSHSIKVLASFEADKEGQPHRIRLSSDAVIVFKQFCEWIEQELGSGSMDSIKDWGGKLAGATLRIAAIIHCVGQGEQRGLHTAIDVSVIKAAQRIAQWAIPHASGALDLLAASEDEAREDAEYLLRWLMTNRPTEPTFDRRDAQRHGHRRFNREPLRLDAALNLLESTQHIAKLDGSKMGGRISYAVSPYVTGEMSNLESPRSGDNGDNQATETPPDPPLSPLSPGSSDSEDEIELTI